MNKSLIILLLVVTTTITTLNTATAQESASASDAPVTNDALLLDATSYAQDNNVSVEEARKRLELQEPFGILNEQLAQNESEHFAGMWIQHSPDFEFVARFTGDFDGDAFKYLSANHLSEYFSVGIPLIYILVFGALIWFTRIIYKRDGIFFDRFTTICTLLSISIFVLAACSDNGASAASLEGTTTPTIHFPQAGANKKSSLEASKAGVLTTNGSCLYVGGTLVMWPSSYRMTIENGLVNVKTRFGKVVAIENEKVSMGGGAVPYHLINNPELTSIFDECPGTGQVWSVSEAELAP